MLKKPGPVLSFDDSVKKASGRKASNIHVRIAPKNNDAGFKYDVCAGSMRDVISADPTSEEGKFVGAGYVHFLKMDPMKHYSGAGDYDYYGKGYQDIMSLLSNEIFFLAGSFTVCTFDRFFTSHPLIYHLSFESLRAFGTTQITRANLPENKREIWKHVKEFDRGEFVVLYCENTKAVLGVHRSAKVTGVLSNFHSDDEVETMER